MIDKYQKEKFNIETHATDFGFIQWQDLEHRDAVLVFSIYVMPEFRLQNKSVELGNFIEQKARELGRSKILSEVLIFQEDVTPAIQSAFKNGGKIVSAKDNVILFEKVLGV
jgi:GNAT superfamily N-acetyltransferase